MISDYKTSKKRKILIYYLVYKGSENCEKAHHNFLDSKVMSSDVFFNLKFSLVFYDSDEEMQLILIIRITGTKLEPSDVWHFFERLT